MYFLVPLGPICTSNTNGRSAISKTSLGVGATGGLVALRTLFGGHRYGIPRSRCERRWMGCIGGGHPARLGDRRYRSAHLGADSGLRQPNSAAAPSRIEKHADGCRRAVRVLED